jgi:two-component system NtrC family sensor kinase
VIDVAAELRYDPNEDDSNPGRSPSAVLRLLVAAVEAAEGSQSSVDVYERVCRALAESGVAAAVLGSRGNGRYAALAHRLGAESFGRFMKLLDLDRALPGAVVFPASGHPLCDVLGVEGALTFPSLAVGVRPLPAEAPVVVSMFAPDFGLEHMAATEAFAALLTAAVQRVDSQRRLREMNARLEQRVRERTRELGTLHDLSLALCSAATEQETARLAADATSAMLPCDLAVAVVCLDNQHVVAITARGALSAGLRDTLLVRLGDSLRALSGSAHAGCATRSVEAAVRPTEARGRLAFDGALDSVIEAPVVVGERLVGLLVLASFRPRSYSPEDVRLLYTLASQLAFAAERLSGARTAERQRLTVLIEGLAEGVVLVDGQGRVLASNGRGRSLLSALGHGVAEAPLPATVMALVARALNSEAPTSTELETEGDEPRCLFASAAPVEDVTGARVVALTLRDTTDETTLRERLIQSEKMASLGQLVCGVAHELNNPLTGILGFARLLLARPLDAAARRDAETVAGEAERASKIVQNLLSFARQRRAEKIPVDINSLIARVLQLQEYELATHDIDVRPDLAAGLPACLADPSEIQQVLLNILTNARQAIAAGARRGTIGISTSLAGRFVRIIITDDGPGIAAEHLRRVFDPFFTTKPVREGTGLGLTISYGIVQEHDGHISLESRPGWGTTFTIDLPSTTHAVADPATSALPAQTERSGRSILVIDDQQAIQNLLTSVLLLDGHSVESVGSAALALDRLARGPVDAVIADIRMPGIDGIEFYRRVRERFPAMARRVILTSGDLVSRDMRRFIEAHAIPFLPKPFEVHDVREFVNAVLAAAS